MKPVLFSSLLLLALFVGVFVGGALTARSIDRVRERVEALPDAGVASVEEADAIHELWQDRERIYLLAVDHRVLADLDRAVSTLCGACIAGDEDLYTVSRHELIAALRRLSEEAGNAALNFL
ncbi:MAG: hypothetical protein J6X72_05520 [Clostridia bacterium]|nr:hypothetical protein [Clostridia bacterium]